MVKNFLILMIPALVLAFCLGYITKELNSETEKGMTKIEKKIDKKDWRK